VGVVELAAAADAAGTDELARDHGAEVGQYRQGGGPPRAEDVTAGSSLPMRRDQARAAFWLRGISPTRSIFWSAVGASLLAESAVGSAEFRYTDALVALLTVETLAFSALAVAVSFSIPSNRIPNLPVKLTTFGALGAAFVTLVAVGAGMAWLGLFRKDWPYGFYNAVISTVLALAIVGQPVFAWMIAAGLRPKR